MKKNLTMYISALTLLATLAITVQLSVRDNPYHHPRIITFDVPGAGTSSGQGTFSENIADGAITGQFIDASGVNHGFLRAPDGSITTFDVLGAGTGSGQGTIPISNNPTNAISGYYVDASGVNHGFLRIPCSRYGRDQDDREQRCEDNN